MESSGVVAGKEGIVRQWNSHVAVCVCVFLCVCVCVCVCVWGHVYVVYEDTNLYNDMGMT